MTEEDWQDALGNLPTYATPAAAAAALTSGAFYLITITILSINYTIIARVP